MKVIMELTNYNQPRVGKKNFSVKFKMEIIMQNSIFISSEGYGCTTLGDFRHLSVPSVTMSSYP